MSERPKFIIGNIHNAHNEILGAFGTVDLPGYYRIGNNFARIVDGEPVKYDWADLLISLTDQRDFVTVAERLKKDEDGKQLFTERGEKKKEAYYKSFDVQGPVRVIASKAHRSTVPEIRQTVYAPFPWDDGTNKGICDTPGYHEPTGIYLVAGDWEPLPDTVTKDDVDRAAKTVRKFVDGFSYASESSKSAAAGFVVAPYLATMYVSKAFMVNAPQQDSGKSLLAESVMDMWGGCTSSTRANSEHVERDVVAAYQANGLVYIIDNLKDGTEYDNATLSGALASKNPDGHLLPKMGTDEPIRVSTRKTIVFTGNSVSAGKDLKRKICGIKLLKPGDGNRSLWETGTWAFHGGGIDEVRHAVMVTVKYWMQQDLGNMSGIEQYDNFKQWRDAIRSMLVLWNYDAAEFDSVGGSETVSFAEEQINEHFEELGRLVEEAGKLGEWIGHSWYSEKLKGAETGGQDPWAKDLTLYDTAPEKVQDTGDRFKMRELLKMHDGAAYQGFRITGRARQNSRNPAAFRVERVG